MRPLALAATSALNGATSGLVTLVASGLASGVQFSVSRHPLGRLLLAVLKSPASLNSNSRRDLSSRPLLVLLVLFPQASYSPSYLIPFKFSCDNGELSESSHDPGGFQCVRCFVGLQSLQPDLPPHSFNSGSREALSCCEWYIYVSLPALPRWPPGLT